MIKRAIGTDKVPGTVGGASRVDDPSAMQGERGRRWWVFPAARFDDARAMAESAGVNHLIAQILLNRGIDAPDEAGAFLNPALDELIDPYLLTGMAAAVDRIERAVRERERIVIFGDFDVDGTTATALLLHFLRLVGANADYYIPRRLDEGYGVSPTALKRLKAAGADLIVTVDTGITAIEEAQIARELGIDLVITDHHVPGDGIPDAVAVVDPKQPGCTYPHTTLAGVGVSFKVAWALADRLGVAQLGEPFTEFLETAMALAACGTITDVMPLVGENRVFAGYGLPALARSSVPGIRALLDVCGIGDCPVTEQHIAFKLGPRLNAGGRLGKEDLGVRLLMSTSPDEAAALAQEIDQANRERQIVERAITQEAKDRVRSEIDIDRSSVIVLAGDEWHPGVIGIVASRLVEEFWRPCALVAMRGESGRGSMRSVPGYNVHEALCNCRDLLVGFGGHAAAAGFEIGRDNVDAFIAQLNDVVSQSLDPATLQPSLQIDAVYPPTLVSPALVRELDRLAPFGEGNPAPLLASPPVGLAGRPKLVGRNDQHLLLYVRDPDRPDLPAVRVIGYNRARDYRLVYDHGKALRIAYTPKLNDRSPIPQVELVLKDVHPA
jgi:single-stranded-DNA-specific exonuclease